MIVMRTLFFFTLITTITFSQKKSYPFYKWTEQEVTEAKKEKLTTLMDSTERGLLFYTNLVRINPRLFCATYLQKYIDVNNLDRKNYYVSSLIKELNKLKPIKALDFDKSLYDMAKVHAISMGVKGKIGHDEFDKRIKKFLNNKFAMIGENCEYGSSDPLEILMCLLIDEGVASLGHRKNLLNPEFNYVGISFKPHKTYGVNCVMDFGQHFFLMAEN